MSLAANGIQVSSPSTATSFSHLISPYLLHVRMRLTSELIAKVLFMAYWGRRARTARKEFVGHKGHRHVMWGAHPEWVML